MSHTETITPLVELRHGHALDVLRQLPDRSVHCCITSPPFFGLRSYGTEPQVWGGDDACEHDWVEHQSRRHGHTNGTQSSTLEGCGHKLLRRRGSDPDHPIPVRSWRTDHSAICNRCGAWLGELGLEIDPHEYIEHLVAVFEEIRRVLRPDGVVWLNLGDSFVGSACDYASGGSRGKHALRGKRGAEGLPTHGRADRVRAMRDAGLRPKNLLGIPWRVALALQARGWYLRCDTILSKRNPMPDGAEDRPGRSHEYLFLLTRSAKYFYDGFNVREADASPDQRRHNLHYARSYQVQTLGEGQPGNVNHAGIHSRPGPGGRNRRSVWEVVSKPYKGAHAAVMSPDVVRLCVLAGTSERGCCSRCAAPWERLVSREQPSWQPAAGVNSPDGRLTEQHGLDGTGTSHCDNTEWMAEHYPETVGWQPTCRCRIETTVPCTVPCTVLDPFAGSGTTLAVAQELGRRAIGVELNERYLPLIHERCRQNTIWGALAGEVHL